MDSVTELYQEELREKHLMKRNHSTSRVSRGGKKLRFSFETMSPKEKREYTKPSEVRITNMYDNLLTREEFENLEDQEKKIALDHWYNKQNYSVAEMRKSLRMTGSTVYNLLDKFEVPRKNRGGKRTKKNNSNNSSKKESIETQALNLINQIAPPDPSPNLDKLKEGLHIFYKGKYTTDEIQAKLEKIGLILDGEESKFEIEIRVNELR